MAKKLSRVGVDTLKEKCDLFGKNTESDMIFKSELSSNFMNLDWLDEIEFDCPYIDNIVRTPKLSLITEEDIVKIEKAKKITVASVKDLSRHTHFIEKVDDVTNDVQPSKILIVRPEETFNIYENRFIFTLLDHLNRFIMKKEELFKSFSIENNKSLEYAANTSTKDEKINIQFKIESSQVPDSKDVSGFDKEINTIKARLKKIKDYTNSWRKSELVKSLTKAHAPFVLPPIRKTNLILKNPNFQIATRLWNFLMMYDGDDNDSSNNEKDNNGDNILKGILDDVFLTGYFVLDSISTSKREQKEKVTKYAVLMIKNQVQRAISLLLNNGIKVSEEEILSMVSNEIRNEKSKTLIGSADVKKKFKTAMDEYLERMQDYL